MKIVLIGASGNVGSRIAAELSTRGHKITAIARDTSKISALPGLTPIAADFTKTEALAAILTGHAAVISSVPFTGTDPDQLIAAVKASAVPRYVVSGGAGSLYVAPGMDSGRLSQVPQGVRDRGARKRCVPRSAARAKGS